MKRVYKLQGNWDHKNNLGYADSLPAIEVEIGKVKTKLLLDTGSNITNLRPGVAAKLGLLGKIRPLGHAAGIASQAQTVMGVMEPLTILGKTINAWLLFMGVMVDDTQGLLGMDVLRQFKRFTVDNEKMTLTVEDEHEEECQECKIARGGKHREGASTAREAPCASDAEVG